jgi:transposase
MIAPLPLGVRVMLCTQPTDMRKSFDGLIAATKQVVGEDPLSGHLFVFVNRRATQAKVLYWSRGGYCIWAKRLERGCFAKVASHGATAVSMTDTQWMMWLDGIELDNVRRKKRFVISSSVPDSATIYA